VKQSLSLKLGQQLAMTPALQQAIRMLQLSTLDLHQEINEALESNMMLEVDEDEAPLESADAAGTADDDIPDNLPVDVDWDEIYQNTASPATPNPEGEEAWERRQANLSETPDLQSHLHWQASVTGFEDTEAEVAAHLIDAIDSDGFLRGWEELRASLPREYDVSPDTVNSVLAHIQAFDPPGVAARSPGECLALQLRQLPADTPDLELALGLTEDTALEQLAAGETARLVAEHDATPAAIERAAELLRSLQPRPGSDFGEVRDEYIVPEVFVTRHEGHWQVALNPDIAPRLRINPSYEKLAQAAKRGEDSETLRTHLQEARAFLNGLRSRNETLLRVAKRIVEEQRAFLEYGEEAMKPLVLRDLADALDIHESTVSRATANKYMQTPRGVFELKYFFSSHVQTTDGGVCSATAIQAMIRRLVRDEPAGRPLSDNKLSTLLLEEGVRVARRTVAKYRELQHIPPSHERKRGTT